MFVLCVYMFMFTCSLLKPLIWYVKHFELYCTCITIHRVWAACARMCGFLTVNV